MDDDENGGLFNIEVSSEEEDVEEKVPRDFQSEVDFQRVKAEYQPKVEVGGVSAYIHTLNHSTKRPLLIEILAFQLWKTLQLPKDNPSKIESQTMLHAIEELYFFKRYEEALEVTEDALKGELVADFRKTLEEYRSRCQAKIGKALKQKEGRPESQ